jgi:hypothetical protein
MRLSSREKVAADAHVGFRNFDQLEERIRVGGLQGGFISALPGRVAQGGEAGNENRFNAHEELPQTLLLTPEISGTPSCAVTTLCISLT